MSKQVSIMLADKEISARHIRMGVDPWDYAFWNGIRCKYPLCCILWFCNVQTNGGIQQGSLFERVLREVVMDNPVLKESKVDRAMCPDCLVRSLSK